MHKKWSRIAEDEKARFKDYVKLEEYECFYLCAKIKDDKVLYRECFSKFDIDGVEKAKRVTSPIFKFH